MHDEIVGHLKEMGLPTVAKGNAGQGAWCRRVLQKGLPWLGFVKTVQCLLLSALPMLAYTVG